MAAARQSPGQIKVKAALQALQTQGISFRGPFTTPMGKRVFIVAGSILTEAEVVSFHEAGKFNPENIANLPGDLKQAI